MRNLKTFSIKTYGCQMNELDSEIMVGQLEKRGLLRVHEEEDADLLIFNTCSIRDLAERKAMGKLGLLGRDPQNRGRSSASPAAWPMPKKRASFKSFPISILSWGQIISHDLNNVFDEVLADG